MRSPHPKQEFRLKILTAQNKNQTLREKSAKFPNRFPFHVNKNVVTSNPHPGCYANVNCSLKRTVNSTAAFLTAQGITVQASSCDSGNCSHLKTGSEFNLRVIYIRNKEKRIQTAVGEDESLPRNNQNPSPAKVHRSLDILPHS